MNPDRINDAMSTCHAELLKCDSFSASKAHELIAVTASISTDVAQSLFAFMRIMNYIEEYPDGEFRAVGKCP